MVTYEERLGKDVMVDFDIDDVKISASNDLTIAEGETNLAQAVVNRLRTNVGELELHPNYGSRLATIIGEPPTDFTLNLAKRHIREALLQEPRIQTINSIKTSYTDDLRNVIQAEIEITAIESEQPLNIIWPIFITGEST